MTGREGLRQGYLRELGIQSYFPRRALPGAKPSPSYVTGRLTVPQPEGGLVTANVQRLAELIGTSPVVGSAEMRPVSARLEPAAVVTPSVPQAPVAPVPAAS